MYFHVVYGGARRRYGGAGRNSPVCICMWTFAKKTVNILAPTLSPLFAPLHFSSP